MQEKKLTLKVPETVEQGIYTNAISVHISPNECILDFAYQLPGAENATLKLLSRVNMNHRTMEQFIQIATNALLDWKNKQKDKK